MYVLYKALAEKQLLGKIALLTVLITCFDNACLKISLLVWQLIYI